MHPQQPGARNALLTLSHLLVHRHISRTLRSAAAHPLAECRARQGHLLSSKLHVALQRQFVSIARLSDGPLWLTACLCSQQVTCRACCSRQLTEQISAINPMARLLEAKLWMRSVWTGCSAWFSSCSRGKVSMGHPCAMLGQSARCVRARQVCMPALMLLWWCGCAHKLQPTIFTDTLPVGLLSQCLQAACSSGAASTYTS